MRDYDWDNSVFDDPGTQWLTGVIYFSLGDYESRKFIFNPKFAQSSITAAPDISSEVLNVFDGFRSQGKHSSPGRRIRSSK